MDLVAKIVGVVVLAAVTVVVLSALFAIAVYYLWNWLMPGLFGLPAVTLAQAWGLTVLAGFLFKSTTTTSSKS